MNNITAKIIKKTKEGVAIEWSGRIGFGQVAVIYDGKGGYHIDAEFVGIETLFEIINAVYNKEGMNVTPPTK